MRQHNGARLSTVYSCISSPALPSPPLLLLDRFAIRSFVQALRSYDPDGDALNTTLISEPRHGVLFDKRGVQINAGDRIETDNDESGDGPPMVLYVLDPSNETSHIDGSDHFSFAVTDDPLGEQR